MYEEIFDFKFDFKIQEEYRGREINFRKIDVILKVVTGDLMYKLEKIFEK